MKKVLLIIFATLLLYNCGSNPKPVTYKVKGKFNHNNYSQAVLTGFDKDLKSIVLDSVLVRDSVFEFTVPKQNPTIAVISIQDGKFKIPVIIGDGDIDMIVDENDIFSSDLSKTTSQLTQQFYLDEKEILKTKNKGGKIMQKYREATDKMVKDSLKQAYIQWVNDVTASQYDYIKENKNILGLIVMQSLMASQNVDFQKIREAFKEYPDAVKTSNLGKYINTALLTKGATEIGGKAPNFVGTTPDGKKLSLNQAMGRVTIIDFWASWCRPCRMENPYMVQLYKKYHDQGLNIIGVSLDKSKEAWLKAIQDDGLEWQHISELKFWQEPVAKIYGVVSIPQTYILDAKGVIRAKNLRRAELEAKVKELMEE